MSTPGTAKQCGRPCISIPAASGRTQCDELQYAVVPGSLCWENSMCQDDTRRLSRTQTAVSNKTQHPLGLETKIKLHYTMPPRRHPPYSWQSTPESPTSEALARAVACLPNLNNGGSNLHPRTGKRNLCKSIALSLPRAGRRVCWIGDNGSERPGRVLGRYGSPPPAGKHTRHRQHNARGIKIYWSGILHSAPRGLCRGCLQSQTHATITQTTAMKLTGGSHESCRGGSQPGHLNLQPSYLPQTHGQRIRYGVGSHA